MCQALPAELQQRWGGGTWLGEGPCSIASPPADGRVVAGIAAFDTSSLLLTIGGVWFSEAPRLHVGKRPRAPLDNSGETSEMREQA
jgi:hypothetical protein